jgi:hypothetical protein
MTSLSLMAAELLAPKKIADFLGVDPDGPADTTLKLFGAREIAAGLMLVRGPAVSSNAWNRVLGDAMDAAALLLALRTSRKPAAIAGALAFVGGAAALDFWTARALDKETGRTLPLDNGMTQRAD